MIANGEIWNVEDASRCRTLSGCNALMLGRGIVADPGLALAIKARDLGTFPDSIALRDSIRSGSGVPGLSWQALLPFVADFWKIVGTHLAPHHRSGRLKQWLNFLRRRYPEAQAAYAAVRTINDPALVSQQLFAHCVPAVASETLLAA